MDEEKDGDKYQKFRQRDTLEGLELMPTYLKISQVLLLRYEEFLDLLTKFNQKLNSFTSDEPDFIEFSIVPGSDGTMFWKLFIGIKCSRISRADGNVLNSIVLSLNQFLSVHQSLTQQMSTLGENSSAATTTQHFNRSLSTGRLSFPVFDTDECCICMERQSNLVLSCTHKLCDECFKLWSAKQSATSARLTCPTCRSEVNIDGDFLLTDAPDSDAVRNAIKESILELADNSKDIKNVNRNSHH